MSFLNTLGFCNSADKLIRKEILILKTKSYKHELDRFTTWCIHAIHVIAGYVVQ